jgi:hypothetical protein
MVAIKNQQSELSRVFGAAKGEGVENYIMRSFKLTAS